MKDNSDIKSISEAYVSMLSEARIQHKDVRGDIVSVFGDFEFKHDIDIEEPEMADVAFGVEDGVKIRTPGEFVGMALHIAQQVGGTLEYKGKEIEPADMKYTDGSPYDRNTPIVYGGREMRFGDL